MTPLVIDLPTTAGPRGSVLPDWSKATALNGFAPGLWQLAPDQPAEPGWCRVRVTAATAGFIPAVQPAAPTKARSLPVLDCARRSPLPTGEVACPSCRGTVRLKIYDCAVFGKTTIARRAPGVVGCCGGCPEYRPVPPAG